MPLRCLGAALLLFTMVLGPAPRAAAEGLIDHARSLERAPAGASFYSAWLRGGDDLRAMLATRAWEKLTTIPGVQLGWMQLQTQWQFPSDPRVQAVKDWVESPEGQELIALGGELLSDEVYVCGGEGWTTLLQAFAEARAMRDGMRINELFNAESDPDDLQDQVTELLEELGEDLIAPELVIGFRVRDAGRAVAVLDRYEPLLRGLLADSAPAIAERLQRLSREGAELLTLRFDAETLPWDQIEAEWTASPELLEEIGEALEGKSIAFAVGVVDGFVVLSMGETIDHLIGRVRGPLLVERDEMRRLATHADQALRTIGYVGGDFMREVDSTRRDLRDLAGVVDELLEQVGVEALDGGADRKDAIGRDARELIGCLVDYFPEPGAVAGVSFATPRGYEGYAYNWKGETDSADASRPLPLVDHVGADSLGWAVSRGRYSPEGFDQMVRLGDRVRGHLEWFAEQQAEPDEWRQYAEGRDLVLPFVRRLVAATRDHLLPGLADGQSAIVLEATAADEAWCVFMPPADTPLPLPSLTMVLGVSDADAVKAAAREYFAVVRDAIDLARAMNPDAVPPFDLPAPAESTAGGGATTYAYPLPPVAGASERLAPCATLGESVLVLGLLPEVAERMAAGSRPELDGPAAEFDRPLLSAAHFKFAKMIDVLRPWIDYGVKFGVEQAGDEGAQAAAMVGFIKPQVDQLLEVLKCWDSVTSVTYREGGAWVTHSETRFIDLED